MSELSAPYELDKNTIEKLQSLQAWLGSLGVEVVEGSASPDELAYLQTYAAEPHINQIAEIGFNAGISSCALLESNPKATVTSFDLGEHDCVDPAKAFIDRVYPGRHTLIKGDSTETVPAFHRNEGKIFDFLFVDGGHDFEVAYADLKNGRSLSTTDTILIVDDLVPWIPYGEGPFRAWEQMRAEGAVVQEELIQEGRKVDTVQPPGVRAWARGRYHS